MSSFSDDTQHNIPMPIASEILRWTIQGLPNAVADRNFFCLQTKVCARKSVVFYSLGYDVDEYYNVFGALYITIYSVYTVLHVLFDY